MQFWIPAYAGMTVKRNGMTAAKPQPIYYVIPTSFHVIPSVAEESEMPALESISRFLDSSATLGMT